LLNKSGKIHILLGVASALFLTGAMAQYLAGYLTAALLGLVLGVFLGIASYRVYLMHRAAVEKALYEEAKRKSMQIIEAEKTEDEANKKGDNQG